MACLGCFFVRGGQLQKYDDKTNQRMSWIVSFLGSSLGKKLVMSLTGLFLITFLVVHLLGNLQLMMDDGGQAFNKYAYKMTHNPVIKTVSYGLYFLILVHTVQGIILAIQNRRAKKSRYKVSKTSKASWTSRNMALLGLLILAFLLLHMGDFWFKMKANKLPLVSYESVGYEIKNLYVAVSFTFSQLGFVIAYVVGCGVLAFHLWHGFQSAFQTLGIQHEKYTPIITGLGRLYSVLIPLGFAIIPVYFYLFIKV